MLKSTNLLGKIILFSLSFALLSCTQGKLDPLDREIGFTSDDFSKALIKNRSAENTAKNINNKAAPVPKISDLVLPPPPPKFGGSKTISFSVTDQVPLKDVLIELGRVAKIDVDVDPNISGGIILNAKNRPLKEVIDRIAVLGELRYSYKNEVLRFEKDSPYTKNYFVDFLADSQLWSDVETNLGAILDNSGSYGSKSSSSGSDEEFAVEEVEEESGNSAISSNKSAGIISIFATQAQHRDVAKYLDDIYKITSAQVLIEAKVVEVTLNKDFQSGIDWSWASGANSGSISGGTVDNPAITISNPNLLGIRNIGAVIKALEKFGTARAISSPRISAMNNQKAVLDFSENLIYFTVSASSATSSGTSTTTVQTITATKNEVPVGVQLAISPSINLDTKEVTLALAPKLSVDSGQVAIDPSVDADGNSLNNTIPIIRTREIATIAKVKSGGILVVGGLMTESAANEDVGVPFLSKIPVLGNLFKYTTKSTSIVETVIFVKATIVNNGTPPSSYDQKFHDNFDTSSKPF